MHNTSEETMHPTIEAPTFTYEEPSIQINPPKRHVTWVGRHAPVLQQANSMHTCKQVLEVYADCLQRHSTDSICKTAASYVSLCVGKNDE